MKAGVVSGQIVEPYAQALMSVAQSNNLADKFGEDIRSLVSLLENSEELRDFIGNPVIKDKDKKAVLRRIVGGNTNAYLLNFLLLLVDKRRIVFLEGICHKYLALLRQLNKTVLAEVISATELDRAQQDSVADKVKAMTDAQSVELKTKIDPDLIGGVIVKVGSQVLDASIRGQLRRIGISLNSAA